MALRCAELGTLVLASPPFLPTSLPKATAAEFLYGVPSLTPVPTEAARLSGGLGMPDRLRML